MKKLLSFVITVLMLLLIGTVVFADETVSSNENSLGGCSGGVCSLTLEPSQLGREEQIIRIRALVDKYIKKGKTLVSGTIMSKMPKINKEILLSKVKENIKNMDPKTKEFLEKFSGINSKIKELYAVMMELSKEEFEKDSAERTERINANIKKADDILVELKEKMKTIDPDAAEYVNNIIEQGNTCIDKLKGNLNKILPVVEGEISGMIDGAGGEYAKYKTYLKKYKPVVEGLIYRFLSSAKVNLKKWKEMTGTEEYKAKREEYYSKTIETNQKNLHDYKDYLLGK